MTAVTVSKFDLTTRKTEAVPGRHQRNSTCRRTEKVLYKQGQGWFIAGTGAAPKPGEARSLGAMEVLVDHARNGTRCTHEVWRIQRGFLYDPNHHGLEHHCPRRRNTSLLERFGWGRADLNYLFDEMLGEVTIGHMFIFGEIFHNPAKVKGGLLARTTKWKTGDTWFARIFRRRNWNPDLRAPLTQPGVDVKVGDYLLK